MNDIAAWMSFDGKFVHPGQHRDPALDPWQPLFTRQGWILVTPSSMPKESELVIGLFPRIGTSGDPFKAHFTQWRFSHLHTNTVWWLDVRRRAYGGAPRYWIPMPQLPLEFALI